MVLTKDKLGIKYHLPPGYKIGMYFNFFSRVRLLALKAMLIKINILFYYNC